MEAPGPPGGYDLHKYFRGQIQSPFPPQPGGYQPTSPSHHQPSHSSYPLGTSALNFQSNPSTFSSLPSSNYTFNATTPQQSSSPVYHGQPQMSMHFNRDSPLSSSPFAQQTSQFQQTPSSPQSTHSLSSSSKLFPQAVLPALPSSPASSQSLDGARLMALLTTQQSGSHEDDEGSSIPGAPHSSPRLPSSAEVSGSSHALAPTLPTTLVVPPARYPSKPPKGRHLRGDHIIYDIDVRKPGEAQPQLEVSPITVYGSDTTLGLGRQIAVNKKFICYGLRGGTIRILNMNSAQKALLRGHTQRVSDMAFFSQNVHLLASASEDGRISVRQIHEGSSENGKLIENILLAIQLVGDWEMCHPRLCWHPNSQEIIFVAIGKYVVTIDVRKASQSISSGGFNAEHPIVCQLESPLKGIYIAAQHDDMVTDLDVTFLDPFHLASASKDGTVRIWGEQKQCLSMFEPYGGNAVDAVSYVSDWQHTSNQHFLMTAGPLNQNLKQWTLDESSSKSGQGAWKCTQTLEFQSSNTSKSERAFYNQVICAPRASVILVANFEKSSIYAIHLDFTSTLPKMDYLAEFVVTVPILSFTVAEDTVNERGEGTLKVFCVQTQAIQQHALDLSQCMPPLEQDEVGSASSAPKEETLALRSIPTSIAFEKIPTTASSSTIISNVSSMNTNLGMPPRPSTFGSLVQVGSRSIEANKVIETTKAPIGDGKGIFQGTIPTFETRSQPRLNTQVIEGIPSSNLTKPPPPLPRRRSRSPSPKRVLEMPFVPMYSGYSKPKLEKMDPTKDIWLDGEGEASRGGIEASRGAIQPTIPIDIDETYNKKEKEGTSGIKSNTRESLQLISPSDIMSLGARNVKGDDEATSATNVENWQEETEKGKQTKSGIGLQERVAEISNTRPQGELDVDESTRTSFLGVSEGDHDEDTQFFEKKASMNVEDTIASGLELPSLMAMVSIDDPQNEFYSEDKAPFDVDLEQELKGMVVAKQSEVGIGVLAPHFPIPNTFKGKKSKNKNNVSQSTGFASSQPSSTPILLPSEFIVDSSIATQVTMMQESINQLISAQRELQKQMPMLMANSIGKESKRLEGSFGQRMEKVVKANVDTMWARILEENMKREKMDRDRMHQVNMLITNFVNKDLPIALERGLKKEITTLGPIIAQNLLVPLQKSMSIGLTEAFQKSAIEKFLPHLEKTIVAKLETATTRQLKIQFQTSGRQTLQEALRTGLETLVIPAFERSCQAMSEQLESAFQTGMAEYTSSAQQQFVSRNTSLATTLQEVINSAKVLNEDLQDSTTKLMELVDTTNANILQYSEINQCKGGLPIQTFSVENVEETLDPTIELNRFIKKEKFEEAFNKAFSSGDLEVISWLCLQLDPTTLLAMTPLPLSQVMLLSLVQHLSFDLVKDTSHKLLWIKEGALALNLNDPHLIPHIHGYLEQTYQNCHKFMNVTKVQAEQSMLRLVIHLINSLLSSCS